MTTKIIGLKEFRQNLSSYTQKINGGDICLIVLNKNRPVLKVFPISEGEFILEHYVQEVAQARQEVKNGKVKSLKQVRKNLGL